MKGDLEFMGKNGRKSSNLQLSKIVIPRKLMQQIYEEVFTSQAYFTEGQETKTSRTVMKNKHK